MFRTFCVSRSAHRLSERLAACSRAMPKPSYSRSQKVGNPIASILKSNVYGIPTLFGLNPVSNFMGFTTVTHCIALAWHYYLPIYLPTYLHTYIHAYIRIHMYVYIHTYINIRINPLFKQP